MRPGNVVPLRPAITQQLRIYCKQVLKVAVAENIPLHIRGVQTGGFSPGFGCEVFVLKLDGKPGFGLNSPGEK
jgi:hypothetical protein